MPNDIQRLEDFYNEHLKIPKDFRIGDIVARIEGNAGKNFPGIIIHIDLVGNDPDTIYYGYFDADGDFNTRYAAPYDLILIKRLAD